MRAAGRRRPRELVQDGKPPPTPTNNADSWQYQTMAGRESDASFCSSRPSSSSIGGFNRSSAVPVTDRSFQFSAIQLVNAYLSSHSAPTVLKPPLPSAKDITETIRFLLTRLGFPQSALSKLEDDFNLLLKSLNCPIKINRSALRAPGTPHSWPSLLGVIHWLTQTAMYIDHLQNSTDSSSSFIAENPTNNYTFESYLNYIKGDDDTVDEIDRQFLDKLQLERDTIVSASKAAEENIQDMEAKLEVLKTEPSQRGVLEKETGMLEEDVKKFHSMIEQLNGHMASVEKILQDKEKELEVKVEERKNICEENEELKKKVEEQVFNARDAERMKRELQAVERDIAEAELARNNWEEKSWDLDSTIQQKLSELEGLAIECNQAVRRLKLGNDFQYEVNEKGSTPAELLGIDYKTTIKPALALFSDKLKKSSITKLDELISLQQQSVENTARIEAKKSCITALQSRIDEVEVLIYSIKKEAQDYTSRCATEARKLAEDVEIETQKLVFVEREAAEYLKASQVKLQETIVQTQEETQRCAYELFLVIDSVSKFKEHTSSKITEFKNGCIETVEAVADIHKDALQRQLDSLH